MTYEDKLYQIARKDDRIIVLTAENRAAIRNLPNILGNRFIDTGITEQTLIGCAAGLALRGRIPIVHALASFLTMRAFEFIRTDIGISHLPVKLVGYVPGLLSEANGPTHQAIEDISLMRSIPGMRIFAPADIEDLLIGLPDILHDPHPWYIRYNDLPNIINHDRSFCIGRSEAFKGGNDITIFVHGSLFAEAYKVMELLKDKELEIKIINMRTLEPFDVNMIINAAQNSNLLVTIEDHFNRGGMYSIIIDTLFRNDIRANVLSIDLKNNWFKPALMNDLLPFHDFDAETMAEKIYNEYTQQELEYVQYNTV